MSKTDLTELLDNAYTAWEHANDDRTVGEHIRAALADAGLAIVPVEPTEAMLAAGEETFESAYTGTVTSSPDLVWPAMLRASQETGNDG